MKNLEVCANSIQSALEAEKGGASRIELCANMKEGGTTPSLAQIRLARKFLKVELYVIIRPRGGNFVYDEIDFDTIKEDIIACGNEKCNGVVFGILTPEGFIDKEKNKELVEIAKKHKLKTTFHRAIDRSNDILVALEDVIELGFDRILTSGGRDTAQSGASIIKKMVEQAGNRIIIMPGSGITAKNIKKIAEETNAQEFHGTFSKIIKSTKSYKNIAISDEYAEKQSDSAEIKEAIKAIN